MKAFDKPCPKCAGQMEIDREHSLLVCPYCGNEMILEQTAESAADQPRSPVLEQKKGITFGTLSMILGILSFLSCGLLCLPELAAIVLVILSFVRGRKRQGVCFPRHCGACDGCSGHIHFRVYMPPPEPHLHGVRTALCRTLNRTLSEQNRTRSRSLSEYSSRLPSGKSALSLIRAQDNLYDFSQEWL